MHNQLAACGIPRFMTGDMNERAPYFCRVTMESPLVAARRRLLEQRASAWPTSRARSTGSSGPRELAFSNYIEDRSPLVARTTDHPMISSDVTVDGSKAPAALSPTPPPPVVPAVTY